MDDGTEYLAVNQEQQCSCRFDQLIIVDDNRWDNRWNVYDKQHELISMVKGYFLNNSYEGLSCQVQEYEW